MIYQNRTIFKNLVNTDIKKTALEYKIFQIQISNWKQYTCIEYHPRKNKPLYMKIQSFQKIVKKRY